MTFKNGIAHFFYIFLYYRGRHWKCIITYNAIKINLKQECLFSWTKYIFTTVHKFWAPCNCYKYIIFVFENLFCLPFQSCSLYYIQMHLLFYFLSYLKYIWSEILGIFKKWLKSPNTLENFLKAFLTIFLQITFTFFHTIVLAFTFSLYVTLSLPLPHSSSPSLFLSLSLPLPLSPSL